MSGFALGCISLRPQAQACSASVPVLDDVDGRRALVCDQTQTKAANPLGPFPHRENARLNAPSAPYETSEVLAPKYPESPMPLT